MCIRDRSTNSFAEITVAHWGRWLSRKDSTRADPPNHHDQQVSDLTTDAQTENPSEPPQPRGHGHIPLVTDVHVVPDSHIHSLELQLLLNLLRSYRFWLALSVVLGIAVIGIVCISGNETCGRRTLSLAPTMSPVIPGTSTVESTNGGGSSRHVSAIAQCFSHCRVDQRTLFHEEVISTRRLSLPSRRKGSGMDY